jgi:hypothetical protein
VNAIRSAALALIATAALTTTADARVTHVRVVHHPAYHRTTVVVHTGFPLRRTLPAVYVRPPVVAVRVAPRVFLPPVVFGAAVVATAPLPKTVTWTGSEQLSDEDGWTDLTMNVDRRGTKLLLDISRGPAQISFAEVVFENGETQVVDFNDKAHKLGQYALLDFADGRKVDHVRIVAKADAEASDLTVRMIA